MEAISASNTPSFFPNETVEMNKKPPLYIEIYKIYIIYIIYRNHHFTTTVIKNPESNWGKFFFRLVVYWVHFRLQPWLFFDYVPPMRRDGLTGWWLMGDEKSKIKTQYLRWSFWWIPRNGKSWSHGGGGDKLRTKGRKQIAAPRGGVTTSQKENGTHKEPAAHHPWLRSWWGKCRPFGSARARPAVEPTVGTKNYGSIENHRWFGQEARWSKTIGYKDFTFRLAKAKNLPHTLL